MDSRESPELPENSGDPETKAIEALSEKKASLGSQAGLENEVWKVQTAKKEREVGPDQLGRPDGRG